MFAEKVLLGCLHGVDGNFSLTYLLDSSSKKYSICFVPSESFSLAKVAFKVGAKTGSPTASIRIETDSSGRPSGTLAWTNATITGSAISAAGWTSELSLTAAGTVSVGTMYHVVIANDAGTPASNNFSINDQGIIGQTANSDGYAGINRWFAFTMSFDGASWANRYAPICVLSDSGGTTKIGQPVDSSGLLTVANSSTGYGIKFTSPLTGSVLGVSLAQLPQSGVANVSIKIYDTSDNLLGTATNPLTGSVVPTRHTAAYLFSSPVSITSGTTYRVVMTDSGAANRVEYVTAPSTPTDYRTIHPLMQDFQWTQGSVGSWTDTPGKLPYHMGLIVSSISAGGSSGMLYVPSLDGV